MGKLEALSGVKSFPSRVKCATLAWHTLQAAILLVKLKYLNEYESRRNDVADFYDDALANIPQITIPVRAKNSTHVFHQYTLQVERRDELKKYLEGKGVPSMIYYPVPLHFQNAYRREGFGEGSGDTPDAVYSRFIAVYKVAETSGALDRAEFVGVLSMHPDRVGNSTDHVNEFFENDL